MTAKDSRRCCGWNGLDVLLVVAVVLVLVLAIGIRPPCSEEETEAPGAMDALRRVFFFHFLCFTSNINTAVLLFFVYGYVRGFILLFALHGFLIVLVYSYRFLHTTISLPPLQQQPPRAIREVVFQLRRINVATTRFPQQRLIRNRIKQTFDTFHVWRP